MCCPKLCRMLSTLLDLSRDEESSSVYTIYIVNSALSQMHLVKALQFSFILKESQTIYQEFKHLLIQKEKKKQFS